MQPARVRPDVLGHVGREGDDVVLRLALDLFDADRIEGATLADVASRLCQG